MVFEAVESRIRAVCAHEDAFLDPRRPWHSKTASASCRSAFEAAASNLEHRTLMQGGRLVELRCVLKHTRAERWARVAPALAHRPRRNGDRPDVLVEVFARFATARPPDDVAHSFLRS